MKMMKRGNKVKVFEDPITRKKLEGTATLIRRIGTVSLESERWRVGFDEHPEDPVVERIVNINDRITL